MEEERTFAATIKTPHGRSGVTVLATSLEQAAAMLHDAFDDHIVAGPVEYDRKREPFPFSRDNRL